MARPTKQGLDYFPIDCQFDDKTELFLLEKESQGLAVLVTIWQLIYQNEGYYIVNNKDLHLLIKKRINVDINEVNAIINSCLCRRIFDENIHKKYHILTSKAIQRRFFDAAKRKKNVVFDVNYIINGINVSNNAVNVLHQSPNVNVNVNVNVKSGRKFIPPTLTQVKAYINEKNLSVNPVRFFEYFTEGNWIDSQGKPVKNWKQKILTWESKNPKKKPKGLDIEAAMKKHGLKIEE